MTRENARPHGGVEKFARRSDATASPDSLVTDAVEDAPRDKLSPAKGLVVGILLSAILWAAIVYFTR